MKRLPLLLLCCLVWQGLLAAPRAKQQMQQIANATLSRMAARSPQRAKAMAQPLRQVEATEAYAVYANAGSFVMVSADDLLPEVLAYSDEGTFPTQTDNPGLKWWLDAISQVAAEVKRQGKTVSRLVPDPKRYRTAVGELLKTRWGQTEPYNNLCPDAWPNNAVTNDSCRRAATGCVATAMAQIFYYHKYPKKGQGVWTVSVKKGENSTKNLMVNFAKTTYDYDQMLTVYDSVNSPWTDAQAKAVATLMYHCGVASNMDYHPDGSGTTNSWAQEGLKRNFGITWTNYIKRSNVTEDVYINNIYNEINENRPVLYAGQDSQYGGHEFVLDGYDSTGLVHVNWGWNGWANGYYDIDLLNPSYKFDSKQEMIIGLQAPDDASAAATVNVADAGTLSQQLTESRLSSIKSLTVSGTINSTDLKAIRYAAGLDSLGNATGGRLQQLDLSGATIVAGGEPYLIDGTQRLTTADGTLPERAFYGVYKLKSLALPALSHIGPGALASESLTEITLSAADDADFTLSDGIITDRATGKEVIAVLPSTVGAVSLPADATTLQPYALANCVNVGKLTIPASIASVGAHAMENMTALTEIRTHAKKVPTTGADALTGINYSACKLYVSKGTYEAYKAADQWSQFYQEGSFDNILEYSLLIKARNTSKIYGDPNPKFGWRVLEGNYPSGDPQLTCDATELSPVGKYTIHASRGTVEEEGAEYEDGTLTILPDTLFARPLDCTREQFQENPEFQVSYTGFDNGEDESVILEKPVVTTTATPSSPIGTYPLTLSGGRAQNYQFVFQAGTLTVTASTGITTVSGGKKAVARYNLSGQPTTAAQRGVQIVRYADGTVRKAVMGR